VSGSVTISDGSGPVTVDGTVAVSGTVPVSGPLTDAQIRAAALPVSGTFWQATQPVSGPLTDTQLRASAVPVSGPLTDAQLRASAVPVVPPTPSTSTLTNVTASVTSGTLLAANAARRGATVWNDSTSILYVRLGAGTAAATAATVKLVADAYYELPYGFTGAVVGVWVSAVGSARVTEVS
jgi:hypothetical protein